MDKEHLSDEEIKKFVAYKGSLEEEEEQKYTELSNKVFNHIEKCDKCLYRVSDAQREQDIADYGPVITSKDIIKTGQKEGVTQTDIKTTKERIEEKLKILKGNGEQSWLTIKRD